MSAIAGAVIVPAVTAAAVIAAIAALREISFMECRSFSERVRKICNSVYSVTAKSENATWLRGQKIRFHYKNIAKTFLNSDVA